MFNLFKKKPAPTTPGLQELRGAATITRNNKKTIMDVKVQKLADNARLPEYANDLDAGMDLFSGVEEGVIISPGATAIIRTGVAMAVPEGYVGLIKDKSGLAAKFGLTVLGGVIDAGYRGEVAVILHNTSSQIASIGAFQKIAQMVIVPVLHASIEEVGELPAATDARGTNGFGSTGLSHSSDSSSPNTELHM